MFQSHFRISGARHTRSTLVGVGVMALLVGVAQAQHDHVTPVAPAAPAMPAASPSPDKVEAIASSTSAPLRFDSVLSRYKPMADQKLGSWREANDTVTWIGGWRTYLKESQEPEVAPPALRPASAKPVAPPTAATPNPHVGHGAKP